MYVTRAHTYMDVNNISYIITYLWFYLCIHPSPATVTLLIRAWNSGCIATLIMLLYRRGLQSFLLIRLGVWFGVGVSRIVIWWSTISELVLCFLALIQRVHRECAWSLGFYIKLCCNKGIAIMFNICEWFGYCCPLSHCVMMCLRILVWVPYSCGSRWCLFSNSGSICTWANEIAANQYALLYFLVFFWLLVPYTKSV
jgi:hypothetical protein